MHFHEHSPDESKNRRIEETVSTFTPTSKFPPPKRSSVLSVTVSSPCGRSVSFSTYKTRTFCGCAALKVVSLNTSGPVTTKATTMFSLAAMRLDSPEKAPTIGAGAGLAKSNKAMAPIVAWMRVVIAVMAPNGEVEGPDDHAGQAPRAHTVFRRPRRQTAHASRTPPTIVRRRHLHCVTPGGVASRGVPTRGREGSKKPPAPREPISRVRERAEPGR